MSRATTTPSVTSRRARCCRCDRSTLASSPRLGTRRDHHVAPLAVDTRAHCFAIARALHAHQAVDRSRGADVAPRVAHAVRGRFTNARRPCTCAMPLARRAPSLAAIARFTRGERLRIAPPSASARERASVDRKVDLRRREPGDRDARRDREHDPSDAMTHARFYTRLAGHVGARRRLHRRRRVA